MKRRKIGDDSEGERRKSDRSRKNRREGREVEEENTKWTERAERIG